jgi:hypothetical protein
VRTARVLPQPLPAHFDDRLGWLNNGRFFWHKRSLPMPGAEPLTQRKSFVLYSIFLSKYIQFCAKK